MKLYKYISPNIIDKIFTSDKHASFKCSYPKDFNDPYELFLTIDFNEEPKLLAFYSDVIGQIPQIPTTCFSKSPSIVPMWAHYAQNLQGFVIEIDEEKLTSYFPESVFGDVDYLDKPNDSIQGNLYRAYGTAKPRHSYFLQRIVFSAAYYTKSMCWSYEIERRMIVHDTETRVDDGIILVDVPLDCISAIFCGPRASLETKKILSEKAKNINCDYFEMKIGRSSATPFFMKNTGKPYIFENEKLCEAQKYCAQCKEPLLNKEVKVCSWCQITKSHKISAAERNPYRMLDNHGLLESYINSMEETRRKHRK